MLAINISIPNVMVGFAVLTLAMPYVILGVPKVNVHNQLSNLQH